MTKRGLHFGGAGPFDKRAGIWSLPYWAGVPISSTSAICMFPSLPSLRLGNTM